MYTYIYIYITYIHKPGWSFWSLRMMEKLVQMDGPRRFRWTQKLLSRRGNASNASDFNDADFSATVNHPKFHTWVVWLVLYDCFIDIRLMGFWLEITKGLPSGVDWDEVAIQAALLKQCICVGEQHKKIQKSKRSNSGFGPIQLDFFCFSSQRRGLTTMALYLQPWQCFPRWNDIPGGGQGRGRWPGLWVGLAGHLAHPLQ